MIRESIDKNGNKRLKIDPVTIEKYMPDLIKYDDEGKPNHLDQNQLILHLLAKVQEHEDLLYHQSELIIRQGKLIEKLEKTIE